MAENIRLALRGIRTHKLRSFLTMLGVIIGIASIIGIVSIVQGTNARLEKSLIGAGNNVTTVALAQDGYEYDLSMGAPSGVPVVSDGVMDRIKSIDGVLSASAYRSRQLWDVNIFYQNTRLSNGRLYGISGDFLDTLQYRITRGRGFTEEELRRGTKAALIDAGAVEALFESDDPIGKAIEIKGEPFVVVGIVRDPNARQTEYEDISEYYQYAYSGGAANVYIPGESWPLLFGFDEPQNVAIHVENTAQMASAGRQAAEELNAYVMSESVRYDSLSSAENENELQTLTNAIQLMLIGIASLSLLVGGIGVMNIMLVSVTERTGEIGLKKALGAKRRTILFQFLTESAVLTGVGGIIGVLVGMGLAKIISFAADLEFGISVPWIIIAVTFSIAIGVLFGAMPAHRASRLNPIDALRRE